MEELNLKPAPLNNKNVFNYLKFFADILDNGVKDCVEVSNLIKRRLASKSQYMDYMKDRLARVQEEIDYGRRS